MSRGTSLKEEVECIGTITRSLKHAILVFTSLPTAATQDHGAHQTTVTEAIEFVEVMHKVISEDSRPQRLRALVCDMNAELFPILFQFVSASLITAPGQPTGAVAAFLRLRAVILQVLTKLIAVCSNDHVADENAGNDSEASALLSRMVGEIILRAHGLDSILNLVLHTSTSDSLKLPGVECLFVMLMRNATIQFNFVQRNGVIGSILQSMTNEGSDTIRNYLCACMRELSNSYSEKLVQEGCVDVFLHLCAVDLSPDVRALSVETFDVIIKTDAHFWQKYVGHKELAGRLAQRLDRESNAEVVETLGKLLETCFTMDAQLWPRSNLHNLTFTEYFIALHGERALVQCLKHAARAASMIARALRFLIQYSPHYKEVGRVLFSHFPSVSLILKICIDHATDATKTTLSHQVLRVELSIAIALCFAQSPESRDLIRKELQGYPAWIVALRDAVLKHLNNASLEYYIGIPIIDCTGTLINSVSIEGIWEDGNKPNKTAIKNIFLSQEHRASTKSTNPPLFVDDRTRASTDPRAVKLTFIILSYATHLALAAVDSAQDTPEPTVTAKAPPYPNNPPPPQQGAEVPSLPPYRESLTPPTSSPQFVPGGRPLHGPTAMVTTPNAPRDASKAPSQWSTSNAPPVYADPYQGDTQYRGPAPTRASILREMRNHPHRAQAMLSASQQPVRSLSPAARSPAATRKQDPAVMELFSKFDAAFSLCVKFGLHYKKREAPKPPVYATTPDGFVIRQTRPPNPWFPVVQKTRLKSWSVKDVKEGDLFFFSIPFTELSIPVVQKVIERAQSHTRTIKRMFITTPQIMKGRRWFLYDMLNHILPKTISVVNELSALIATHGEDNIKFPVFMFREKEIHVGQRAVHSGNVMEVLEQVRYYFSQQPPEAGKATSQYMKDIEAKIRALSQQKYTGTEIADLSDDSDEDILLRDPSGGTAGGHGGLDSDCDTVSSEDM